MKYYSFSDSFFSWLRDDGDGFSAMALDTQSPIFKEEKIHSPFFLVFSKRKRKKIQVFVLFRIIW
tara:strand:+ start:1067 stop:1261 length:195 start_codon:yes stop_codon:yes gene_type:complete